jgi:transcriptional regulator with XRE-family HTH domain
MAARSRKAGGSDESKDPMRLTIGSLIKGRRNQIRDLTQVALSAKAGLPSNAVGELERGNRRLEGEELVRLCIELDVPVDDFLDDFKVALAKSLGPIEQRLRAQREGRAPDRAPRAGRPVKSDEDDVLTLPEDPTVLVLAVQVARAGGKDLETTIQTVVRALNRHRRDEEPDGTPSGRKR